MAARRRDRSRCSRRSTTASRAARPGCASCASEPSPRPRRRARRAMTRDRRRATIPARRLPPLPGHSSRGRLERVLRARPVRRHRRAQPARLRRPARGLRPRARALRGLRRDQRHRRLRRQLPHVERRHLRAADPRRLCAGACRSPAATTTASPSRATCWAPPRMGVGNILCLTGDGVQARRPARAPSRSSTSIRIIAARDHPHHARRAAGSSRPQDHRAAAACSWARPRTPSCRPTSSARSAWPRRSRPAPSSSRPSIASTCRCSSASWRSVRDMGLHEKCFILVGVGPLASARDGALDARPTCRASTSPTRVDRRGSRAPQNQKAEGKQLCIELIQQIREIEGVAGVHVMAYRQEESSPRSSPASGRACAAARSDAARRERDRERIAMP